MGRLGGGTWPTKRRIDRSFDKPVSNRASHTARKRGHGHHRKEQDVGHALGARYDADGEHVEEIDRTGMQRRLRQIARNFSVQPTRCAERAATRMPDRRTYRGRSLRS